MTATGCWLERDGDHVLLITRGVTPGPIAIRRSSSALKNRRKQFVIDGESVLLGVDGIADFNALHSRKQDDEVQLYAFDIMALDSDDLRELPLTKRKVRLEGC